MIFKVGDTVKIRPRGYGKGIAKVVAIDKSYIGVTMEDFPGHDLGGTIKAHNGWWFNHYELVLCERKKNNIEEWR